jgi:DNA mismatch endonuclease (patch repair protein)
VADYPHPLNPGRSANMRANRRTDTKPEMALRRALHRQGFRYRKDFRIDLDGARVRPDIAFTARRVAVFVDGCFWHVCPEHGTKPANNTWYWGPKLTRNVERDRTADQALEAAGWRVVRIWEHVPLDAAVAAVVAAVGSLPSHAPVVSGAVVPEAAGGASQATIMTEQEPPGAAEEADRAAGPASVGSQPGRDPGLRPI